MNNTTKSGFILLFVVSGICRAFGVLMWEIMSLGSLPYEELSDEELPSAVCEGQCRLPKPLNCKTELYVM